jgi:hypothetical protein
MKVIKFVSGLLMYLIAIALHILLAYCAYVWFGWFWCIVVFFVPFLSDIIMLIIVWGRHGFLNTANVLVFLLAVFYFVSLLVNKEKKEA